MLTAVGVSKPGKIVRENAGMESGASFGCQFCGPLAEPRDEVYLVNHLNISVANPGTESRPISFSLETVKEEAPQIQP
jgi:hypothetical protein